MNYVEVTDVVKQYDGHVALDHVSLEVPQGCVYGLLGPNGAGKTSLIRIINQITRPDSGSVRIAGHDLRPDDIADIGYLPEERGLYKKMRVADHLIYLGRLKGLSRADAVQRTAWWLDRFDLAQWRDKKVEALSKGMQQKVQFIATVIHRPRLLIFDEPFSGFDPVNAEVLKREILHLRDEGATVLFSTHNMNSVEAVCEQISLINRSRVVLQGRVDEIRRRHRRNIMAVELARDGELPVNDALYRRLPPEPGMSHLVQLQPGVALRDAVAWLNGHCELSGFHEVLPSMNEVFINTVTNTSQS